MLSMGRSLTGSHGWPLGSSRRNRDACSVLRNAMKSNKTTAVLNLNHSRIRILWRNHPGRPLAQKPNATCPMEEANSCGFRDESPRKRAGAHFSPRFHPTSNLGRVPLLASVEKIRAEPIYTDCHSFRPSVAAEHLQLSQLVGPLLRCSSQPRIVFPISKGAHVCPVVEKPPCPAEGGLRRGVLIELAAAASPAPRIEKGSESLRTCLLHTYIHACPRCPRAREPAGKARHHRLPAPSPKSLDPPVISPGRALAGLSTEFSLQDLSGLRKQLRFGEPER